MPAEKAPGAESAGLPPGVGGAEPKRLGVRRGPALHSIRSLCKKYGEGEKRKRRGD